MMSSYLSLHAHDLHRTGLPNSLLRVCVSMDRYDCPMSMLQLEQPELCHIPHHAGNHYQRLDAADYCLCCDVTAALFHSGRLHKTLANQPERFCSRIIILSVDVNSDRPDYCISGRLWDLNAAACVCADLVDASALDPHELANIVHLQLHKFLFDIKIFAKLTQSNMNARCSSHWSHTNE